MMANWAELSDDLLSLILSNVYSIKDRCNVRLVCKSWNSVALLSPCPRQTPCLMFYQNSKSSWKLYKYNGFFRKSFEVFDDEILYSIDDDDEILCSKHGWLLMSFGRFYLYFFNPSDGEVLEVTGPEAPLQYYNNYCFIHPPTSPNCVVVGYTTSCITVNNAGGMNIGVIKRGENNWNNYNFDYVRPFEPSKSSPILHRGLLYILDVEGNVGTFNIEKQSTWTIHADCLSPYHLRGELRHQFLIKLDEEGEGEEDVILAVFVYGEGKKVKVCKLSKPHMKWELVKSLGDKMLYVSRTTSFAETAPVRSMANKIFFPYLHDGDDSVVYYSLDTKEYHSFGGKYSFSPRKYLRSTRKNLEGKWNGLTELPCATWITNISPK